MPRPLKTMTSRERLLAAFRRETPDRVPIFVLGVQWLTRTPGQDSLHASFAPLYDYVRARGDYIHFWSSPWEGHFLCRGLKLERDLLERTEEWDTWKLVLLTPRGELHKIRRDGRKGQPGLDLEFFIRTPEDLEKFLSLPYSPPRPELSSFTVWSEKLGEQGLVMADFGTPVAYAHELLGSEGLALWSVEYRLELEELLELFYARIRDLLEHMLAGGVGPLFGSSGQEYATPPLLSPRDFHDFVALHDQRLFHLVHQRAGLVRVHCHGRLREVLDSLRFTVVDALHPVEAPPMGDITLGEFRRRVANGICIKGNIQVGELMAASASRVRELVRQALREGAGEGAFILAPTASSYFPVLTPHIWENYRAMIDTALEYGAYPM